MLLLAAHALTPESFGVFAAVTVAILLVGRVVAFGCEHAFMRLRTLAPHANDENALLGAALLVPAACLGLVFLATLALFRLVEPELRLPLVATTAAAAGWASAELAYWIFLARGRHARALAAQAGTAIMRLLVVATVALTWPHRDTLLLAYAGSGLVSGGIAIVVAARGARRPTLALVLELVRYARWQGLAQILSAFAGQQAILMLLLIGNQPAESGMFSLALSLMFGVFFIYAGLFEQLSAEVSEREISSNLHFLRSTARRTAALIALSAIMLLFEYVFAPFILPQALWSGGAVFVPLAIATLITLAHAPLEALLHGRLMPRIILESRFLRILLVGLLGLPVALLGNAEQMAWIQVLAAVMSLAFLYLRLGRSKGQAPA